MSPADKLEITPEAPETGIASLLATPDLSIDVIRSSSELAATRERAADRQRFEELLSKTLAEREAWTLPGFCQVCARAVAFEGDLKYSRGRTVNFRERLVCPNCGFNNRKRFMAHVLRTSRRAAPEATPTYLFEQVTRFFAWARESLPGEVVGSEYLGADVPGGTTVEGIRHEDALALSFRDAAFGAIASCDVFEHVPDIDRCLAECARVLAPGGHLIFSIPFYDTPRTRQRAAIRDKQIVELVPPEYHANPVDPQGSLVFYNHGWDILDRCRGAGFADAYALGYWSLLYGYLGDGLQLLFVAEMRAQG
jgi:SAM-dependent methyltransferase